MLRRRLRASPNPNTSPPADPSPPTAASPHAIRPTARRWLSSDAASSRPLYVRRSFSAGRVSARRKSAKSVGFAPAPHRPR